MPIYEFHISLEILLETQTDVNKMVKELTDKVIPEDERYVGHFAIEANDIANLKDDESLKA